MENQKLQSSPQIQLGKKVPEKWQERFLIKRIDEEDIEITLIQRDAILRALNEGQRFIQIGKYTLMLNGIKSIDPKWGGKNIPPCPSEEIEIEEIDGKYFQSVKNREEIKLWHELFEESYKPLINNVIENINKI